MLTPTASSQIFAGIGLWSVIWSMIYELDKIAKMVHMGRFVNKERMLAWINGHKTISIIITEVINFGWHGTDSGNSVLFALGGSFTNIFMIAVFGPIRAMLRKQRIDRVSL